MEIKLYQKNGTYEKKDTGEKKPYTNFYVKVGNTLVPINVPYFPNPALNDRDPNYNSRVAVLKAFAEELPEKEDTSKKPVINPREIKCPICSKIMQIDDRDEDTYYLTCDCKTEAVINVKTRDIVFTDSDGNELPEKTDN